MDLLGVAMKYFVYLVAIFAMAFAFWGILRMYRDVAMRWVDTNARVIDYELEGNVAGRPSGWAYLTVEYEYTVDGKKYTSDTIYSDQEHTEVPEDFAERVGLFGADNTVAIQYSAKAPELARLATRGTSHYAGGIFIVVVLLVFSTLLFLYANAIQSIWVEAKNQLSS